MSERKLLKLNNKYVLDALCMLRSCSLKDTRFTTQNEQFYEVYDYIQELEAQIQELNDDVIWWTNRFNALERENKQLKNKIDKAIEYINNHTIEWVDKKFEKHNVMVKFNEYANPQTLLEILGDKE